MSDIAVTMPGKYGDIFWSLATIKEISEKYVMPVDFYTSPNYSGVSPIVEAQYYINEVHVLADWEQTGDSPGIQPWRHPSLPKPYQYEFAIGYKRWPQCSLIDDILDQVNEQYDLGLQFDNPIPFLRGDSSALENNDICFGFSWPYDVQKAGFMEKLFERLDFDFSWVDASYPLSWKESFDCITSSKIFVGDKSSLHVLAHGLGKPVVETESNSQRRYKTFINPYSEYWTAEVDNILNGVDEYAKAIEMLLT